MRCPKCRAELEEDAIFCTNCGVEIESYIKWSPDYQENPKKETVPRPEVPKDTEKTGNFVKPTQTEPEQIPKDEILSFSVKEEVLNSSVKKEVLNSSPREARVFKDKEYKPKEKKFKIKNFKVKNLKEKIAAKEIDTKETAAKEINAKETAAKEIDAKNISAKDFLKKNFKAITKITCIFAVVLFAAGFIYNIFFAPLDTVITVYDEKKKETIIYLNNKRVGTLDAGVIQICNNMDRSAFYFVDGSFTVWYLKGNKLVEVMEDCQKVVLANHNKTALLIDKSDCLFRYNGYKLEKITEEEVYNIAVSGNGKYYSYTVLNEKEYNSYIGTAPNKETKVENSKIFAISEKGEYFYSIGRKNYLQCINRKGEAEDLGETVSMNIDDSIMLNEDGDEIMFIVEDETYISKKGKEAKKVADFPIERIYGKETGNQYCYIQDSILSCVFYPIDTFKKSVGYTDTRLSEGYVSRISSSYKAEKIVKNVRLLYGTNKNASKIYYLKSDALYTAKVEEDAKETKLTDKDDKVSHVYFSKDSEEVYFITDKNKIGCIKKNGKTVYVDIKSQKIMKFMAYKPEKGLYIETDYEFFYVNGTKVKELKNIKGIYFDIFSNKVYAYTNELFYQLKNGTMKKLKGDFSKIAYITA